MSTGMIEEAEVTVADPNYNQRYWLRKFVLTLYDWKGVMPATKLEVLRILAPGEAAGLWVLLPLLMAIRHGQLL